MDLDNKWHQGLFRNVILFSLSPGSQIFLALCYNNFFPQIHYSYVNALDHLNFHIVCTRRHHLDALSFVNIYNGFKFCPSLLLAFAFILEILETFLHLLLVPYVKLVPLLDVHQVQILFAKILTYSANIWLCLTIF
jgi:hypothetical protein